MVVILLTKVVWAIGSGVSLSNITAPAIDAVWSRVLYGCPSVHGAVILNRKSYGPVRCGFKKAEILRCGSVRFSDSVNPTVRSGAGFKNRKRYVAVRCFYVPTVRFGAFFTNQESYGAVPWGFQIF